MRGTKAWTTHNRSLKKLCTSCLLQGLKVIITLRPNQICQEDLKMSNDANSMYRGFQKQNHAHQTVVQLIILKPMNSEIWGFADNAYGLPFFLECDAIEFGIILRVWGKHSFRNQMLQIFSTSEDIITFIIIVAYPNNKGSNFVQNIGKFLPEYTVSHKMLMFR
jgi:hypothetical protein